MDAATLTERIEQALRNLAAEQGDDRGGVARKLEWIERCVHELRTLARPEEIATDLIEQRFVEHTLQIAVQAALATAAQILARERLGEPGTDHDLFTRLVEQGWLPATLAAPLHSLVELRDDLVHGDVDPRLVADAVAHRLDDLLAFVRAIRERLPRPKDLAALAAELKALGFGRIEEDLALRATLAVRRKDPSRGLRQIASAEVPAALAETALALRRAISFLKSSAQIPHLELLPDRSILDVLALFFHEHAVPRPRTRLLLTRWVWRWSTQRARRRAPAVRQALDLIIPGDEEEAVRNLLAGVGERPSAPLPLRPFDFRGARSKLQLIALATLVPRHLIIGEALDIAALCEQPKGPAVRLSARNRLPAEEGLANRLLHPPLSGTTLRERLAVCEDAVVLRSHCISPESRQALRQGDLASFLDLREADLQKYVGGFLESRAQWEASDRDRPSMASLIVADE